jgi:hypothetical protein
MNVSNSEFINSRLNLIDDQITLNYDLTNPTHNNDNEK